MAERKKSTIKLFGKTIRPWLGGETPPDVGEDGGLTKKKGTSQGIKDTTHEIFLLPEEEEEVDDDDVNREENESSTANSADKCLESVKNLPCPRCSSKDTKFCYYNNYSVNQPRHFCKNCLRYWTSGGVMRNLPVGAGRRKNKTPTCVNAIPNEPHHPLKPNETVLNFGSGAPPTPKNSNQEREHQVPYFNGAPCPYPWSFPISFYPVTAYWNMPWLSPSLPTSPSSCSEQNSTNLGKRSRKGEMLKHMNSDKEDSMTRGQVFVKDFQCKEEHNYQSTADSLKVLYANPLAFSLSLNFQESS